MPRPAVKGRTRAGSRVLAVRIDKKTYEDFMTVCEKNNLDKATVIEKLLLNWMVHNVDKKTLKLKRGAGVAPGGGSEVVSPMGHSQGVNAVSESVNKCPVCGRELYELEPGVFWCSKCKKMYRRKDGRLEEV